jgi:peroxiredoxin
MAEHAPHELDARPQSRREWSGWLRSLVLPIGLVVAIVAGLLLYQSRSGDSAANDGYGTVDLPAGLNTTGKAPAAEDGRAAPDFRLLTLDGEEFRLSDFHGRPIVVNFWATWCGPCRVEMPDLVETYLEHGDEGLMVVAVNQREANERVQPFVDEFGLPFPIAMDRRGEVGATWRIGGAMEGLPSSYFVDRDGIVRKVVLGPLTARHLSDGLNLILGGSN